LLATAGSGTIVAARREARSASLCSGGALKDRKWWSDAALAVLAVVFTVALSFASVELPSALARLVDEELEIEDIHPYIEPDLVREFVDRVRPIAYTCLAVVVFLVVVGLLAGRTRLSKLGAALLFMPTFGYFAAYMFFLAGLGVLRALWLPFWGRLIKLGDVAYVPYVVAVCPFALAGIDARRALAVLAIGLGLLIFFLGTLAWLRAKRWQEGTAKRGIYRFSRHPQYLGWIVWSYGLMLLASQQPPVMAGENPGASLPWVVSSLVIVCVALGEEMAMKRERGTEYDAYRARAPFLIPLPRFVSRLVGAPLRAALGKERPETWREVLVVFFLYLAILVLLSLPFYVLDYPGGIGWSAWVVLR
jgi:protein-S-isoprenylcysteine O-methyltransferase Ste14